MWRIQYHPGSISPLPGLSGLGEVPRILGETITPPAATILLPTWPQHSRCHPRRLTNSIAATDGCLLSPSPSQYFSTLPSSLVTPVTIFMNFPRDANGPPALTKLQLMERRLIIDLSRPPIPRRDRERTLSRGLSYEREDDPWRCTRPVLIASINHVELARSLYTSIRVVVPSCILAHADSAIAPRWTFELLASTGRKSRMRFPHIVHNVSLRLAKKPRAQATYPTWDFSLAFNMNFLTSVIF